MSSPALVRINSDFVPLQWWRQDNGRLHVTRPTGWDEIRAAGHRPLVLLLPANWVYLTETHIPAKSREVLAQSIPFAVEEELSNDVEANHYAHRVIDDARQQVAVIERELLDSLRNELQQHGVHVDRVHSEAVLCPQHEAAGVCVALSADDILLCGDDNQCTHTRAEQLAAFVQLYRLQHVHAYGPHQVTLPDTLKVTRHTGLSDCFASALSDENIDLLGDLVEADRHSDAASHTARRLLWVGALVLLSWAATAALKHRSVNQGLNQVRDSQLGIMRALFSDLSATEQAAPYAAFQSRLKSQSSATGSTDVFIDALTLLGQSLQQTSGVELLSVRFNDGSLEASLQSATVAQLNALQSRLQSLAFGFRIVPGARQSNDDHQQVILSIRPL